MREEKVGITRHDLHVLGGDAVGLAHHLVLVRADDHLAVILQAFPAMVNRFCEPGQGDCYRSRDWREYCSSDLIPIRRPFSGCPLKELQWGLDSRPRRDTLAFRSMRGTHTVSYHKL